MKISQNLEVRVRTHFGHFGGLVSGLHLAYWHFGAKFVPTGIPALNFGAKIVLNLVIRS